MMNTLANRYRYIFIALGVIFFAFVVWYFSHIVAYILISAVLALMTRPLTDFITRLKLGKMKFPRWLASLLTVSLILSGFYLFFRLFIPLIVYKTNELSSIDVQSVMQSLNEPLANLHSFLRKSGFSVKSISIDEIIREQINSFLDLGNATRIFGVFASLLGDFFIAVFAVSFITFFFLKEENLFADGVLAITPSGYEENMSHALTSINYLLRRYFIGIIIQTTLVGLLVFAGMLIVGFDVKNALILGLLSGILNIIPYAGPWLGTVAGILIGIAGNVDLDFYAQVLPLITYMLFVYISVQIIDNVVFQPIIFSNSVVAHPLEIFIVLLMAGSLGGLVGMFLAIPGYTVLRVMSKEFLNNLKLVKRLTRKI